MVQKSYLCLVCNKHIKNGEKLINCRNCKQSCHAARCSNIFVDDNLDNFANMNWLCSQCLASNLPFSNLNDIEVLIVNYDTQKHSTTVNINPNSEFQGFIDNCENFSLNDDDNDGNMPLYINSSYHNIEQINAIKPDPSSSFGVIHTNLASIDLHFDDPLLPLSLIDIKFNIIGITEHKIRKNKEP